MVKYSKKFITLADIDLYKISNNIFQEDNIKIIKDKMFDLSTKYIAWWVEDKKIDNSKF